MQCKLCHSCWLYWKKYGGLKVPSRIGKKLHILVLYDGTGKWDDHEVSERNLW